ncbi:hypothetical protein [Halorubellus sp. PRR65]|uniref:hypothetical protein n=1 Tax=Halorubellus sp. PRR65 TaxID=3098148 RepID=UPI002B263803|nr:hypothetical protein [Halorubellus sp. PRR65]
MPTDAPASPTQSADSKTSLSTKTVLVVLVVSGVVLVTHPLYLFPHHGQTPYTVGSVERVDATTATAEETVAYDALSPAARESFDAARDDDWVSLWTGEDDRAIDVLSENRFVRDGDRYYRYSVGHADDVGFFDDVLRVLLTSTGGVLLALALLLASSRTWPPMTPRGSLVVVGMVALALFATQVYDVRYSGAVGGVADPFPTAVAGAFGALGVGSLVRRRGTALLRPLAAAGVLAVVAGTLATGAHHVVAVAAIAFGVVVGGPLVALGYVLTPADR